MNLKTHNRRLHTAQTAREGAITIIRSGRVHDPRFARGLKDDLRAIIAGLTLEWSNGVTEGQIHRLKLLKRQSYGRAGVALLRQRILQVAYRR